QPANPTPARTVREAHHAEVAAVAKIYSETRNRDSHRQGGPDRYGVGNDQPGCADCTHSGIGADASRAAAGAVLSRPVAARRLDPRSEYRPRRRDWRRDGRDPPLELLHQQFQE